MTCTPPSNRLPQSPDTPPRDPNSNSINITDDTNIVKIELELVAPPDSYRWSGTVWPTRIRVCPSTAVFLCATLSALLDNPKCMDKGCDGDCPGVEVDANEPRY